MNSKRSGARRVVFTVVFFFTLWHVAAAQAVTYYAANNGNDANPGTQSQPFRTITRGLSSVRAGDTLYLRGGAYADVITGAMLPTASSWATAASLRGYPGEVVTINGGGKIDINVTAPKYFIFSDFAI